MTQKCSDQIKNYYPDKTNWTQPGHAGGFYFLLKKKQQEISMETVNC